MLIIARFSVRVKEEFLYMKNALQLDRQTLEAFACDENMRHVLSEILALPAQEFLQFFQMMQETVENQEAGR